MRSIQQTVQVTFNYPVYFTTGLFAPENLLLKETIARGGTTSPHKLLCIVDRNVSWHDPNLIPSIQRYCLQHSESLHIVSPPLIVPGGEEVKNEPAHVAAILEAVDQYGLDRHSYMLVIGGGAVIDMVGYAAATAHRGIRLIRIPTTVLAQNDSAVGVKNSINAFGKKNFLGTFAPPYAVLNDSDFLRTLSDRDWRSGISEAVKVALLKDANFFEFLEEHAAALVDRNMEAMEWLVYRCAELHLDHIATSGDPFEMGSSRPLDFGHWAAHKLEQLTNYKLRHGEAVAIGIALDSTYAYLQGWLPQGDWVRILRLFAELEFALYVPEMSDSLHDRRDSGCLLCGLDEFREHLGGELTVMLLRHIGRGIEVHAIDEERMVESIKILEMFEKSSKQERTNGHLFQHMSAQPEAVD